MAEKDSNSGMGLLKNVLLGLAVILGILFIFPLFLSSHVVISASEEIHAPAKIVFGEINNLHNQKLWYPFKNDSVTPDSIPEPSAGVGATRYWVKGDTILRKLVIEKSRPSSYLEAALWFGKKQGALQEWHLSGDTTRTNITWKFQVLNLHYPFGRWLGLVIRNSMKPALEAGLKRLKKVAEAEAKPEGGK